MQKMLLLVCFLSSLAWAKQVPAPLLTWEQVQDCAEDLKPLRPKWTQSSREYVCKRSDPLCVLLVAKHQPRWDSFALTHACGVKPGLRLDENCVARALAQFDFFPTELGNFCRDPRSECMLTYKETRPQTSKTMTDAACLYGITHNCPAQIAATDTGSGWDTLQINQACRSTVAETCPVELVRALEKNPRRGGPGFVQIACKKMATTCPAFLVEQGKKWGAVEINQLCQRTDFACLQEKIHRPELKYRSDLLKACPKIPDTEDDFNEANPRPLP